MKSKLARMIMVLALFGAIAAIGYYVRGLMSTTLEFHSFWHYLVRVLVIMATVFGVILAIQLLSAGNPADSLGEPPPPEAPFKLSNVGKRLADVLLSITILTLLFPILVITALLVFVLEGYPIFYISKRYISLHQCISVLKFRTMVKDATSPKYRLKERFMRNGYLDIPLDCEVFTPIGRILERTQLVEILQLFNVLLHGMSLIGNRPLPRDNINLLRQYEGWQGRFSSPAGLSGLSQIVGKLNQSPQERLELECLYANLYRDKNANIFLCDACIAYYTVRLLLLGKPLPIAKARQLVVIASGR